MCVPINRRDPKTRRLLAIANLSLAAAIVVLRIDRSANPAAQAWLDGMCGFLFGVSIGINLLAARCARQCSS